MKNTLLVLILLLSTNFHAQDRGHERPPNREHHDLRKDFSIEQKAELMTKRMVLDLNLSEKQQKEIQKIHVDLVTQRETRKKEHNNDKLTSDDHFERRSQVLDQRIAAKKRFKAILNKEQFDKFERAQHRKKHFRKGRHGRKKR
ncbi:MAG: hypothetical protein KJO23_02495 [Bacteroidia bacterium]|nr:hypothetical protein [Bacteroidia bacterium]NNM24290.1 hypothetical protein [Flavobacteriaceae bacterium]